MPREVLDDQHGPDAVAGEVGPVDVQCDVEDFKLSWQLASTRDERRDLALPRLPLPVEIIGHLDEVLVTIRGQRHYLWRAVDQDGCVLDILVQARRDRRAAQRLFRKLLKGHRFVPNRLVTDKLRSYGAAHRETMPSVRHVATQNANNRAEGSHQPTRQREYQMRRFK